MDFIFGLLMPVICFVADPIVFKGDVRELAYVNVNYLLIRDLRFFVYAFSSICVLLLVFWMIMDKGNSIIAGVLFMGGLMSLGIGIVIFPVSLIGLFLIAGLLGFTPFFTGYAYLRNAIRMYALCEFNSKRTMFIAGVLMVLALFCACYYLDVVLVNNAVNNLAGRDIALGESQLDLINLLHPIICLDSLLLRYVRINDYDKETAMARIYKRCTGKSIQSEIYFLRSD